MEISFRTKINLTQAQFAKAKDGLKYIGIIDDESNDKEVSEILKQEMVYGSLQYLVEDILKIDGSSNIIDAICEIHKTTPKGYTSANGLG